MPDDAGPAEADVSGGMSDSENDHEYYDAPIKEEDDKMTEQNAASDGVDANGEPKKKYDPKDPLRPRRKKARRACYACQRAHLTCGKRGISSLISDPLKARDAAAIAGIPQYSTAMDPWLMSLRRFGQGLAPVDVLTVL